MSNLYASMLGRLMASKYFLALVSQVVEIQYPLPKGCGEFSAASIHLTSLMNKFAGEYIK